MMWGEKRILGASQGRSASSADPGQRGGVAGDFSKNRPVTVAPFPRAIIHVDGDSFFAACEIAKDPTLKGKPVITGKERGIVSACTYDAKARGVTRGMRLFEAKKLCPEAIILPSDYETYSLFSERMYEIVRRYTPTVEEYSIDECFADLTPTLKNGVVLRNCSVCKHKLDVIRRSGFDGHSDGNAKYDAIFSTGQAGYAALHIKHELDTELGMTFSVGLSATKVLAKIGSKWKKPDGLTVIPLTDAGAFLRKTPVEKIWGIGPNTAAYVNKYGIRSALDFVEKEEAWITDMLAKPYVEIWHELRGEMIYKITTEPKSTYQSISKTKTFTPPSRDQRFVFSQLSKNIENACIKARRWNLVSPEIFFFLKTQDFKYHGYEIKLSHPSNVPQDILRTVAEYFPRVWRNGEQYRATGITLLKLQKDDAVQLDLFGKVVASQGLKQVFESVDELSEKYGKHVIFLGSSFEAVAFGAHPPTLKNNMAPQKKHRPRELSVRERELFSYQAKAMAAQKHNVIFSTGQVGERGDAPERTRQLFRGESARRRLAIPSLGEVN